MSEDTAKVCTVCGVVWYKGLDEDWIAAPCFGQPFCEYLTSGGGCTFIPGTVAEMVAEFHAAMGDEPGSVAMDDHESRDLRFYLLSDEFNEYVDAECRDDIVKIVDALADMVYVIYGTAYTYGIPLDDVLKEVHRSNMTKTFVKGGKAKKGADYSPPDIESILNR